MGKFDTLESTVTNVFELTDELIENFVESIIYSSGISAKNPDVIEKALLSFEMPTRIGDAKYRITHYCEDFFDRLESVGCRTFREVNSKVTIKLLLKHLKLAPLKSEMHNRVMYDERLEKNFKLFIVMLTCEEVNCQVDGRDTKETQNPAATQRNGNNNSSSTQEN